MTEVLVLQSFREQAVTPWVSRCLESVRAWADGCGYAYRFKGDALFDLLPDWYRHKVGERTPVLADLARLLWMNRCLAEREAEWVVWVDADVLVFAPELLAVAPQTSCFFGRELWVQESAGRVRTYRNVHNAWCGFRQGCVVLPFLIDAVQRLVKRVDPDHIAPQFVGPKLLTSLHNLVGFELDERVGALSPLVVGELVNQPGPALASLRQALEQPLAAANLCASLHADDTGMMTDLVARLGDFRNGLT